MPRASGAGAGDCLTWRGLGRATPGPPARAWRRGAGGRGLRADEAGRGRLSPVGQAVSRAAGPSVASGQSPTLEATRAGIATGARAGLAAAPGVTSDSRPRLRWPREAREFALSVQNHRVVLV